MDIRFKHVSVLRLTSWCITPNRSRRIMKTTTLSSHPKKASLAEETDQGPDRIIEQRWSLRGSRGSGPEGAPGMTCAATSDARQTRCDSQSPRRDVTGQYQRDSWDCWVCSSLWSPRDYRSPPTWEHSRDHLGPNTDNERHAFLQQQLHLYWCSSHSSDLQDRTPTDRN